MAVCKEHQSNRTYAITNADRDSIAFRRAATLPNRDRSKSLQSPDQVSPTDAPRGRSEKLEQSPTKDEDGTEAHKEHISSATFFSRQPLDKPPPARTRSISTAGGRLAEIESVSDDSYKTQNDLATRKARSRSFKRDREIEVSIKSEDETQHLLGDLPPLKNNWQIEDAGALQDYSSGFSGSETEGEPSDFDDLSEYGGDTGGAETPRVSNMRRSSLRPPQAIELNPFSHQVGGHTLLYRISRHAVCKKLNNRENKFYETIEQFHPELLDFMPR